MSNNFNELLKSLQDVAADTDEMAAKPSEAAEADEAEEGEDDATIKAAAAEEGKGELGKSFSFKGEDGAEHEAIDATDLVKSLMERQESSDGVLAKALETFTGVVQKQGEMIKSLSAKVSELSSQGRGRKTMLTVSEKPNVGDMLAKSSAAEPQITKEQFFTKANTAFDQGKLTGKELNVVSVCLRMGEPIDPALIQKIALA